MFLIRNILVFWKTFIFTVFYYYFWDILCLFDERNTSCFLCNTKIYRINY